MLSFSASVTEGQMQYILATKDSGQSKSDRLRELVEAGIQMEDMDISAGLWLMNATGEMTPLANEDGTGDRQLLRDALAEYGIEVNRDD